MGLFTRKKSSDERNDLNPSAAPTQDLSYTAEQGTSLDPHSKGQALSSAESTFSDATTLTPNDKAKKKSLYQKYQELKRGPGTSALSDDDLKKYTGMNREELDKWAATTPGVAGGQRAGSVTAGGSSGLGMMGGSGEGLGGWGFEASKVPERMVAEKKEGK